MNVRTCRACILRIVSHLILVLQMTDHVRDNTTWLCLARPSVRHSGLNWDIALAARCALCRRTFLCSNDFSPMRPPTSVFSTSSQPVDSDQPHLVFDTQALQISGQLMRPSLLTGTACRDSAKPRVCVPRRGVACWFQPWQNTSF